jgi:homoserine dehydrogenase
MGAQARLVMVLHRAPERRFLAAVDAIGALEFMRSRPRFIRVVEEEYGV